MKIDINNVTEDFIKSIQNSRIADMHLQNHGPELSNPWMEFMLKSAKEAGPFADMCKEELKDNDKT